MNMETTGAVAAAAMSAPAATAAPAADAKVAALASDFETFLQMLTAQARFQNPLEPIDSTEYAAQLAQFSMVEQQVQTNENLNALFSLMGVQNAASLAAWVGMEARAVAPAAFAGQPVTLSLSPDPLADAATLVVKDSAGVAVQRRAVDVAADQYVWSGLDDTGSPMPFGKYTFEVESSTDGTVTSTTGAAIYARVEEAQIAGSDVMLIFEGGQVVPAASVTALRDPAGPNEP